MKGVIGRHCLAGCQRHNLRLAIVETVSSQICPLIAFMLLIHNIPLNLKNLAGVSRHIFLLFPRPHFYVRMHDYKKYVWFTRLSYILNSIRVQLTLRKINVTLKFELHVDQHCSTVLLMYMYI